MFIYACICLLTNFFCLFAWCASDLLLTITTVPSPIFNLMIIHITENFLTIVSTYHFELNHTGSLEGSVKVRTEGGNITSYLVRHKEADLSTQKGK